ncbi:MAG: MBL fold metallo-hydrolase [Candidatus Lokiarchaeota archaeon]|nr:MBL fold metallo-hydrolase [Candidatus Lokiarchaeota archaeon]MBD3342229.1 MBL fold metallo-hydrolase [Candidatus Lokiarchaeota archaeon]
MKLKKIRSEGLAHLSYLLISENEACVIDPRRDAKIYTKKAFENNADIKYVLETHRNEDYVIGSTELLDVMGLKVYHGPGLAWEYGITLEDGQILQLGGLKIQALHTPGHTDESMSYAVYDTVTDTGDDPVLVFTGDALFVGDVGRTDMYGSHEDRRMAENLYESLFNKLLSLGDQTIICPAHGSGSVCGAGISDREESTIGLERKHNPILQMTDKDEFVQYKIEEHHYFLPYFKKMEEYNLKGAPLLKDVPRFKPLNPKEFQEYISNGATILDTRNPDSFGAAHIEGSYNIWLEGLSSFAGWVIPYDKPILLVVKDFHNLNEAHKYLLRLGYDNIAGYLIGGIKSWYSNNLPTESNGLLTARALKSQIDNNANLLVLDVRSISERKEGYIEGSTHIYVGELETKYEQLPDKPIATVCGNGSRASLGTSILLKNGLKEAYTVLGSMKAWNQSGYPVEK